MNNSRPSRHFCLLVKIKTTHLFIQAESGMRALLVHDLPCQQYQYQGMSLSCRLSSIYRRAYSSTMREGHRKKDSRATSGSIDCCWIFHCGLSVSWIPMPLFREDARTRESPAAAAPVDPILYTQAAAEFRL